MLAFLRGTILSLKDMSIVVDVHDLGYAVSVPGQTLFTKKVGDAVELFLYEQIREDSHDLYGFETRDELYVFEKLVSVSGVGPKTALNALNSTSAQSIKSAIVRGDAGLLKTVSGIGAKTAERITVELRGVFQSKLDEHVSSGDDTELIEALIGLGYSPRDAQGALREIPRSLHSVEERLKAALKHLSASSVRRST